MEGKFYRTKRTNHPHTNSECGSGCLSRCDGVVRVVHVLCRACPACGAVAKASLNMLTRTSAEDYAAFRVYMNSVDTGWVTDEEPLVKPTRDASGLVPFQPPLDEIDGAARVLDPVRHLWLCCCALL